MSGDARGMALLAPFVRRGEHESALSVGSKRTENREHIPFKARLVDGPVRTENADKEADAMKESGRGDERPEKGENFEGKFAKFPIAERAGKVSRAAARAARLPEATVPADGHYIVKSSR